MSKREEKKAKILKAAEEIFSKQGFDVANMNDVAAKAGVSKGTVYFYFNSKENLYMAIAYRALMALNDMLYEALHQHKDQNGKKAVLALVQSYMQFSETHPLYADAMLDYMALVRGENQGLDKARASKAMQESIYFTKLKDIHNIPLTLTVREIQRGRKDGSIINQDPAVVLYMNAWALVLGYMKISKTSPNRSTLFTIPIDSWRDSLINMVDQILSQHQKVD